MFLKQLENTSWLTDWEFPVRMKTNITSVCFASVELKCFNSDFTACFHFIVCPSIKTHWKPTQVKNKNASFFRYPPCYFRLGQRLHTPPQCCPWPKFWANPQPFCDSCLSMSTAACLAPGIRKHANTLPCALKHCVPAQCLSVGSGGGLGQPAWCGDVSPWSALRAWAARCLRFAEGHLGVWGGSFVSALRWAVLRAEHSGGGLNTTDKGWIPQMRAE